jgi:hypothetical protein
MEFMERERKVADAILLERAARVLKRRCPDLCAPLRARTEHEAAWALLLTRARELRQEAESGASR